MFATNFILNINEDLFQHKIKIKLRMYNRQYSYYSFTAYHLQYVL